MSDKQTHSKENQELENIDRRQLTCFIRPLIHKAVIDVMKHYAMNLMVEPDSYIAHAIWGTEKDGSLDRVQREIYKFINPSVMQILENIRTGTLNCSEKFAMEFLIREKIIFNIAFLVEKGRRLITAEKEPMMGDMSFREFFLGEILQTQGNA